MYRTRKLVSIMFITQLTAVWVFGNHWKGIVKVLSGRFAGVLVDMLYSMKCNAHSLCPSVLCSLPHLLKLTWFYNHVRTSGACWNGLISDCFFGWNFEHVDEPPYLLVGPLPFHIPNPPTPPSSPYCLAPLCMCLHSMYTFPLCKILLYLLCFWSALHYKLQYTYAHTTKVHISYFTPFPDFTILFFSSPHFLLLFPFRDEEHVATPSWHSSLCEWIRRGCSHYRSSWPVVSVLDDSSPRSIEGFN